MSVVDPIKRQVHTATVVSQSSQHNKQMVQVKQYRKYN